MLETLRKLLPAPICCSLNSLAWSDVPTLHYAYMFMHCTVKDFRITLPGVLMPAITKLLVRDISSRMPLLRVLHVILGCGLGDTSDMFVHLLQNLPQLSSFSLENAHLSSGMVQQLSCLSRLEVLCSLYGCDEVDDQSFPSALRPGAFPALHDLTLTTDPKKLSAFFATSYDPSFITKLHISSTHLPGHGGVHTSETSDISTFISVVAAHCPGIEDVCLDLIRYSSDYSDTPPLHHVITFDTLYPLSSCRSIRSFTISHEYSLSLDAHQVIELVQHWPKLTHLSLNPSPTQITPPTLRIEALVSLALHCPDIQYLGLHIDCCREAILALQPIWEMKPFAMLGRLNVGLSPLDNWHVSLAAYIGHLCPHIGSIETVVPWERELHVKRSTVPNFVPGLLDEEDTSQVEEVVVVRSKLWLRVTMLLLCLRSFS
jgi:hypothetical protein